MNEQSVGEGSKIAGKSSVLEGKEEVADEVKTSTDPQQHDQTETPTKTSRSAETFEDKQRKLLLADCYRLKKRMTEAKSSIHRPPLKPFTPYLFNSLEPYYNQYLVNYTIAELQGRCHGLESIKQDNEEYERPNTNYGQRATSLGIVEPQISWKMDNVPGPYSHSRLSGNMSAPKKWGAHMPGKDVSLGSTRLPPFPKPSFPKINLPEYQPCKMDYSKVLKFRIEMDQEIEKLNKRKTKLDYDRTFKDWERMNLIELKELPPYSRYHVNKAIKTYFGTSKGGTIAINSLSKKLDVEEE